MEVKLGTYLHYKGKKYEVIGNARDSDDLKEFVVYKPLYKIEEFGENPLFIKNLEGFTQTIELDGKVVPRFEYLGK